MGEYQDKINVIRGCTRCSLSSFRTNLVIYRGNPRANIMAIGEAPGRHEDLQGKPFVGDTGGYFVDLIDRFNVSLRDIYITNVVMCRPPSNADPTKEQMDACANWVRMQIDLVNPKYIIAVGRLAASRLLPWWKPGRTSITREEGNIHKPPHLEGKLVIPVRHPSAIKRVPSNTDEYELRIEKICKMMLSGKEELDYAQ